MEKYTFGHTYLIHKIVVVISEASLIGFGGYFMASLLENIGFIIPDIFLSILVVAGLAWIGMAALARLYDPEIIFDFKKLMGGFPFALFPSLGITILYLMTQEITTETTRFLPVLSLFSIFLIISFRWGLSKLYAHRRVLFPNFKVVIVGSEPTADALYKFFMGKRTSVYQFSNIHAHAVVGVMDQLATRSEIDEMKTFCLENDVSEMCVALPPSASETIKELLDFADDHHIRFRLASNFSLLNRNDISVHFYDQTPIITLRKDPLSSWANRMVKRAFDIVFSSFVVLFILPFIYLIVGALIKLESKGPVIYRQLRNGRKNKSFFCYKFRTMYVQDETKVYQQATKEDPRITKVGRFLRRTSLDEFPQFINVLQGHMSVVGPRPHPIKLNEMYTPKIDKYQVRHLITPGVTGYAQVHGYRGETKDPHLMEKRVEYDGWYIQHWSLFLDLKIVFLTMWNALRGEKNAY